MSQMEIFVLLFISDIRMYEFKILLSSPLQGEWPGLLLSTLDAAEQILPLSFPGKIAIRGSHLYDL